jgi:hypothetical protein
MSLAKDSSAGALATRGPRARPAADWQALADAPRLEVCGFLEPIELLRLEMCARQSLGDGPHAFQQAARAMPRGLQLLSDKRTVSAHARLTSLYPTSMDEAQLYYPCGFPSFTGLNGFTFSWLFFWEDGSFRTAAFEHLNIRRDHEVDDAHPLRSDGDGYVFEVPDDASGQGIMAPLLLKSQEYIVDDGDEGRFDVIEAFRKSWRTTTQLYCTRKRDGAVCKVLHMNGCADGHLNEFDRPDLGSICLDGYGSHLLLSHANTHLEVYILFDSTNGRLRDIKLSMHVGGRDDDDDDGELLEANTFCALLDDECDKESLLWALRRDRTAHDY